MGAAAIALPAPPADGTLWVGYSGGGDSTALLHLLRERHGARVRAVHVHHGLQPAADEWLARCRDTCRRWGVPFTGLRVAVAAGDPAGPEGAARQARYAALGALLAPGDVLATAHHLDDQAETVLLRLLRGTGVTGLAGIPAQAPLGAGLLWRPLLAVSRDALQAYARAQRLRWIEDPHNGDERYARSWLRRRVLPQVARRVPAAGANIARAAALCGEAAGLLAALADADLAAMGASAATLPVAATLALDGPRRHNLLHRWLRNARLEPTSALVERLEDELLRARADAAPCLAAAGQELRRYRDSVHRMAALPPAPGDWSSDWDGQSALVLPPGCGTLQPCGGPLAAPLRVHFDWAGRRLRPAGSAHRRTLKNLAQEAGLPPWQRERMPLLARGGAVLAVADRWIDAAFVQELAAAGGRVEWQPGGPSGMPG